MLFGGEDNMAGGGLAWPVLQWRKSGPLYFLCQDRANASTAGVGVWDQFKVVQDC